MLFQGMPAGSCRVGSVTWDAASPTVSVSLTKDRSSWRPVFRSSLRERHGLTRRIDHMAQTDGVMLAHIELQLRPTPSAGSRDSGPQRSSGRLCALRRAQTVPVPCWRRPVVRDYGPVRIRPTGRCRCRVRNHLAAPNRIRRAV